MEILVYIVSFTDLKTRQIFRTTCGTLNHYVAPYHFAFHNTTIDQLKTIEQQLSQRPQERISVDFRNPPLAFRLKALTAIKSISKCVNITSLNLLDVTSELYKHKAHTTLDALTALTNLQRLAIKTSAIEHSIATFTNLTKLTLDRGTDLVWYYKSLLSSLKNLQDLTLMQCDLCLPNYSLDKLTRLCIYTSSDIAGFSIFTNLKQLIVAQDPDSYATLDTQHSWTALEHITLAVKHARPGLVANTNLTRLELRCHEALYDLRALADLTQLQILSLDIRSSAFPVNLVFLDKMPLRSLHLSIAKLDSTLAIQHLNVDLLRELSLNMDANVKCKDQLTRLTNLESLALQSATVQSVTLTSLTRLTRLRLHKVQCGAVACFVRLKTMSVVANQRPLSGLSRLTDLEQLRCALKPSELTTLAALTSLRDLQLTVQGALTVNFFTRLLALTQLKLDAHNFPAPQWLTCLTCLVHLDLSHTAVTPKSFEALTALSKLTQLKVTCKQLRADLLFRLTRLQRIRLAPFENQPVNFKEQCIKNLPHFVDLQVNLDTRY